MSLNPSCNSNKFNFKRLGDPPFSEDGKDCAINELKIAGFPRGSYELTSKEVEVYKKDSEAHKLAQMGIHIPSVDKKSETEWVTLYSIKANIHGWKFRRAWYYWVAEGDEFEIPKDAAEDFNAIEENKNEVRVDGYAGGKSVNGPVSFYHIDTQRGLNEFIKFLEVEHKKWYNKIFDRDAG